MQIKDLIITANRNLWRNKLRTLLTVMAIFVGSFTLTLTNGLGDGLKDYIDKQVRNYEGNAVVFVRRKFEQRNPRSSKAPPEYVEGAPEEEFDPNTLAVTRDQIDRLASNFPEVRSISPNFPVRAEYVSIEGGTKYQTQINAVGRGVTQKLEAGRQIDGPGEIILQYTIAKAYSEDFNTLLGRRATIGFKAGNPATMQTTELVIVGVATKGFMTSFFSSVDSETEKRIYDLQREGSPDYGRILSFSMELANSDEATIETVKKRLDERGFVGETMADQSKRTQDAIGIFQIGMNLFAMIALLAASFGIINTLVIAVMERTKEIGLQKALGMGRGKVFFLFAFESVLLGFWGALAGIVGAVLIGTIGNSYASKYFLESFEGFSLVVFRLPALTMIVVLISVIAFLAGVLPAYRASRLDPIEALRYE